MKQQTILITGSSRGIGRAIAELAHEKGYKVVINGRSDSSDLQEVEKRLPGCIKVCFDTANKKETIAAIKKIGPIDILINNAGMCCNKSDTIDDIVDERALDEYRVNVLGTLHCIQAVLPGMLEKNGGSIVNVASIRGHYFLGRMKTLTYATTKAGIISLTQTLAKTYPAIRFNSASPGFVATDMISSGLDVLAEKTLMKRVATADEVAKTILFLASSDSSYMTGTDVLIDGGYSLQGS